MQKLGALGRFLLIFLYVLGCLWVISVVLPAAGTPERRGRVIKRWAGRFLRWLGICVKVHGAISDARAHECGITPGAMGRLLLANHCSVLDIFILNALAPSSFVAKAEISRWPVFGRIAAAVGTIFIERGKKRALLSISERMQEALREGRNLLLFPEGTTSDGRGLLPLHANLMEAAARTGAAVIPIVIRYKAGDEVTTRAAYTGSVGLFECIWKILNTPGFHVDVLVLDPIHGDNRHVICRQASAAMCAAIGVPDPLAAAAAVHATSAADSSRLEPAKAAGADPADAGFSKEQASP